MRARTARSVNLPATVEVTRHDTFLILIFAVAVLAVLPERPYDEVIVLVAWEAPGVSRPAVGSAAVLVVLLGEHILRMEEVWEDLERVLHQLSSRSRQN